MNSEQSSLARKQLERRLAPLRGMVLIRPPKGWIRAIRGSLGITARQLAACMGTAPSRIPAIEKAEVADSTTLRLLRQAAAVMNCSLAYAFVSIDPLEEILRQRAFQKHIRNFLSRLHQQTFRDVWRWAGQYRIAMNVRHAVDDAKYWVEHGTYLLDEFAARFSHRLVAIHPFPNGNGRFSRLVGDLLAHQLGQKFF